MTTGKSWAERGVPVGRAQQPVDAPAGWSRDIYVEEVERFYVPIVDRDNRVLRVAENVTSDPRPVVSAFFDRSMRGEP